LEKISLKATIFNGANMNRYRVLSFAVVILFLAMPLSIRSQTREEMRKEMNEIRSEVDHLDKVILDNKKLSGMLRDHEARLLVLAENPQIYRLPVLIEGKALYVTVSESELDDFSSSLALEDLLVKYKVTKGRFRSDDPSEWKKVLIRESRQAKDHLRVVELPAIQKRIAEVDQETCTLEAKRNKLLEKYKILQRRVGDA
jgi:arsenate reductase-like glutaredoxin family protein